MAITTLDGVLAGMKPAQNIYKTAAISLTAGRNWSTLYMAGVPGAAVAPAPGVAGAALTTYAGQIPFSNPVSGNSYLAKFSAASGASVGSYYLCDRLWHNSGLSVTSTSAQVVSATISTSSVAAASVITTSAAHNIGNGVTVNISGHAGSTPAINGLHVATYIDATSFSIPVNVSVGGTGGIAAVAWPARDMNGATDGAGVMVGFEVSATMGSGTPTWTMVYTNQAGTIGKTVTTAAQTTAMAVGSFIPIELAAGDTGVRSIQTWTNSATMTSGAFHLVAYRILAQVDQAVGTCGVSVDCLTGGFPRLYDNTVPFILFLSGTSSGTIMFNQMIVAQG